MYVVGFTDTLTMSVPLQAIKSMGADKLIGILLLVSLLLKYIETLLEVPYSGNTVMISYLNAGKQ